MSYMNNMNHITNRPSPSFWPTYESHEKSFGPKQDAKIITVHKATATRQKPTQADYPKNEVATTPSSSALVENCSKEETQNKDIRYSHENMVAFKSKLKGKRSRKLSVHTDWSPQNQIKVGQLRCTMCGWKIKVYLSLIVGR